MTHVPIDEKKAIESTFSALNDDEGNRAGSVTEPALGCTGAAAGSSVISLLDPPPPLRPPFTDTNATEIREGQITMCWFVSSFIWLHPQQTVPPLARGLGCCRATQTFSCTLAWYSVKVYTRYRDQLLCVMCVHLCVCIYHATSEI